MKKRNFLGIVSATWDDVALVTPISHAACDSGHCCQGEGVKKVTIEMKNEINAVVGEKIIYEAKEVGMIIVAFILFLMPLILTGMGAIGGYYLHGLLGLTSSTSMIAGGILSFIISIIIIKKFENYLSQNTDLKPVIIKKSYL